MAQSGRITIDVEASLRLLTGNVEECARTMREFDRTMVEMRERINETFISDSLAMIDPAASADTTIFYGGRRGGGMRLRHGHDDICDLTLDSRDEIGSHNIILRLSWREHPADDRKREVCYGLTHEVLINIGLLPNMVEGLAHRILENVRRTASHMSPRDFSSRALEVFRYAVEWELHGNHQTLYRFESPHSVRVEITAKKLLLSLLSSRQRREFDASNGMTFSVQAYGEFYEVQKESAFSVVHPKSGRRYCVTTPGLPLYDQMAAIKLLLESDPDTFFKTANVKRSFGMTIIDEAEQIHRYHWDMLGSLRVPGGLQIQHPGRIVAIDTQT